MVKGVNKKIIEINNPQSIFFEKAVFYLKPNVVTLHESVSGMEISRMIQALEEDIPKPVHRFNIGRTVILLLIITALAGIAFAVLR